jgi:hypothetical protein
MLNIYCRRLFWVPREYSVTTNGFPTIVPNTIVGYLDKHVEGTMDSGDAKHAYIKVESSEHEWNVDKAIVMGKTTFKGVHFSYSGGNPYEVNA